MKTKKFLGQHFLTSEGAIFSLIEAANLQKGSTVLEIGPGRGVLTEKLLETGANVVAVEKDSDLLPVLKLKFDKEITSGRLVLIDGDILDINLADLHLQNGNFKLVANIPYNITGKIIKDIIGGSVQPSIAVLVVQKEVAERIIARNGKESLLSLAVKVYGTPKYIKTVKSGSFAPSPAVDSAIISIEDISRAFFTDTDIDENSFFNTIRDGFGHKRKQLQNNLNLAESTFESCNIKPSARAEDLSLEDWKCLVKSGWSPQLD